VTHTNVQLAIVSVYKIESMDAKYKKHNCCSRHDEETVQNIGVRSGSEDSVYSVLGLLNYR